MLKLTWTNTGLEDLEWWQQHDNKMLKRIIKLGLETCKNPIKGIGKPEPLKFNLQGYWSRRITEKHRFIYTFDDEQVIVIQCRHHYKE
ncbi:Txe/YoeB family addiction module toxin [Candidatus Halobeggiatoa sp. HSG11]|nr:Txe/YoeB family addiction module toxin [Candidatus Halobeggiatoa sp. HSG11]